MSTDGAAVESRTKRDRKTHKAEAIDPDDSGDEDLDEDGDPVEPPRPMTLREALNSTPGVINYIVDDKCPVGDSLVMLIKIIGRTGHDLKTDKRQKNMPLVQSLLDLLDSPLPDGVKPFRGGCALGADEHNPPGSVNEIQFGRMGTGGLVVRALAQDPAKRPPVFNVGDPEKPVDLTHK